MKRVCVKVTYTFEIVTGLEDDEKINELVADYVSSSYIEDISNGSTYEITDIYDD